MQQYLQQLLVPGWHSYISDELIDSCYLILLGPGYQMVSITQSWKGTNFCMTYAGIQGRVHDIDIYRFGRTLLYTCGTKHAAHDNPISTKSHIYSVPSHLYSSVRQVHIHIHIHVHRSINTHSSDSHQNSQYPQNLPYPFSNPAPYNHQHYNKSDSKPHTSAPPASSPAAQSAEPFSGLGEQSAEPSSE
jgi:hypothetical protein